MRFQLWENKDNAFYAYTERDKSEVHERFHDMKVGEQRPIGQGSYLIRVE